MFRHLFPHVAKGETPSQQSLSGSPCPPRSHHTTDLAAGHVHEVRRRPACLAVHLLQFDVLLLDLQQQTHHVGVQTYQLPLQSWHWLLQPTTELDVPQIWRTLLVTAITGVPCSETIQVVSRRYARDWAVVPAEVYNASSATKHHKHSPAADVHLYGPMHTCSASTSTKVCSGKQRGGRGEHNS